MAPTKYKRLDDLCRASIEDYDDKVSIAWGIMDRMRCSLDVAAPWLYSEICAVLENNEIDVDGINVEEIISA